MQLTGCSHSGCSSSSDGNFLELVACAYADEEAHNDPYMEQVVDEHVGLDTDIDEHEQRVKDENDQSK